MKELNFLFQKKIIAKLYVFCYENNLTYLVYLSDQKFHNSMDLLLISDENKSHYVHIKDFNRFMYNKTKNKNNFFFPNVVYSVLVVKTQRKQRKLIEHKF